ncbi:Tetratricopeptide repeat [Trypanosoma melophagium]|uniref:Tetratricopeptide repeat n=1 Tax=Trypanosoma melophagium TaxID=715481 RepID=UPI00351A5FE7|nr:Tetratricopeptide repeat [Trypanosoma melophagium]
MGGAASSGRQAPRASSAPPRSRQQPTLLVSGNSWRPASSSNMSYAGNKNNNNKNNDNKGRKKDAGVDAAALRKIEQRRRQAGRNNGELIGDDTQSIDTDPATLHILNAVKEADSLPEAKATLKLQLLRGCYPYLEQVPPRRFDHLAVLVYQKEGDVYFTQGDTESAKTTYSRAIQIAETRVARGEKEIYMVLKRYVLAMVGMARIWYEQERQTTGFTFAKKDLEINVSLDESMASISSCESSVLSDASIFSLNQEILKSMAPKAPRRRVGPAVNVVRLLRPAVARTHYTAEDDFVLRSQMARELKASPCELLLLRCIEVVEIGHRRQSELLIPALIELAQIYEDLKLYNRSLLLVRRCLGILSVVYDYDHPWIIQLRRRADYLMDRMDEKLRDGMATKIQATWKMHKAMCQLEEKLGRPVARHVWMPKPYQESTPGTDFLKDFVNELPEGTVLYGTGDADGPLGEALKEINGSMTEQNGKTPSPVNSLPNTNGEPPEDIREPRSPSSMRRSTRMGKESPLSGMPLEEPRDPPVSTVYPAVKHGDEPSMNTLFIPNARVVSTVQDTMTDTQMQDTEYGGVLTIRTTTVTRTITEQEVGSDEESSFEEEEGEEEEVMREREPMKEPEIIPERGEPIQEQVIMVMEEREVIQDDGVMEEEEATDDDDEHQEEEEPGEKEEVEPQEGETIVEEEVVEVVRYSDGTEVRKVVGIHREIIKEGGDSHIEPEEEDGYEIDSTSMPPRPLMGNNVDTTAVAEGNQADGRLTNRYSSSTNETSSASSIEGALYAESVAQSDSQESYQASQEPRRRMRVWKATLEY